MKNWYQVIVKSNRETDDGLLKQVSQPYLFDAVSYTDAETRAYEWAEDNVQGEFSIVKISQTNLSEVVQKNDHKLWFKAKVIHSTVDGDSDKEVKVNHFLLVSADNINGAYEVIEQHLNSMLVPYTIQSIIQTSIEEVIVYQPSQAS